MDLRMEGKVDGEETLSSYEVGSALGTEDLFESCS